MAILVIDQGGREHWFHDPPEIVIKRLLDRNLQLEDQNLRLAILERLSSDRLKRLAEPVAR